MNRPPPNSTLFPHPTLFRSPAHDPGPGLDHATGVARHVLGAREVDLAVAHVLGEAGVGYRGDGSIGRLHELLDRLEHARRDRKSTRLNSSHSQISYAVFCLK